VLAGGAAVAARTAQAAQRSGAGETPPKPQPHPTLNPDPDPNSDPNLPRPRTTTSPPPSAVHRRTALHLPYISPRSPVYLPPSAVHRRTARLAPPPPRRLHTARMRHPSRPRPPPPLPRLLLRLRRRRCRRAPRVVMPRQPPQRGPRPRPLANSCVRCGAPRDTHTHTARR